MVKYSVCVSGYRSHYKLKWAQDRILSKQTKHIWVNMS